MRISIHHEAASEAAEAVRAGLVEAWAEPITTPEEADVLLVVFGAWADAVADAIRVGSQRGQRVLAVASHPKALAAPEAWELLSAGASDLLLLDDPEVLVARVTARLRRWQTVDRILSSPLVHAHLVGESQPWRQLLRRTIEVACFSKTSVLVTGETGTGKELVARLLHTLDRRPEKKKLVVLDCTTVAPELAGSEFFGHERGAYTSAVGARDGAFALADEGTLFLDEVGELPLTIQAELLRVIQEGTYKRVGSNTWQEARFRLVCATHRDLKAMVNEGRFRADLYHRFAAVRLHLPPLRERRTDILPLVRHELRKRTSEGPVPALDPFVSAYFLARDYSGNVRELKQLVARIMSRHVGDGPITIGDIPPDERPGRSDRCGLNRDHCEAAFEVAARQALAAGHGLKQISTEAGNAAIRLALHDASSTKEAAMWLGVSDRAIQLRVAKWRKNGTSEAGNGKASE